MNGRYLAAAAGMIAGGVAVKKIVNTVSHALQRRRLGTMPVDSTTESCAEWGRIFPVYRGPSHAEKYEAEQKELLDTAENYCC